ncbi:CU044_5270 family protein [Streptomyces sp. JNUCC 64]
MDEMTTVRAFRADAPTPARADLVAGRDRLLDETTGTARRGRRLGGWAAVTASTAAVVAVALTLTQLTGNPSGDGNPPGGGELRLDNAAAVLEAAATAIEGTRRPEPRPDQWVYTKDSHGAGHLTIGSSIASTKWIRYDGAKVAFVSPFKGEMTIRKMKLKDDERTPQEWYALLDSLPQDPEALLRTLRAKSIIHPKGKTQAERDFTEIRVLLGNSAAMPVDVHAALYRALARIPGVRTADRLVKDALGRKAIAVTFIRPKTGDLNDRKRHEVLLDPKSYEPLGSRIVAAESFTWNGLVKNVKKGDLISAVANVSRIVDKPGQTS